MAYVARAVRVDFHEVAGTSQAMEPQDAARSGETELAVEMLEMTKWCGRVAANDHVTLRVRRGEVHALVGENGAGKSTLMHLLYGLRRRDSGVVRVNGAEVKFDAPSGAIAAGIGMVHQHFMLVPVFTVTENIILGAEPARGAFVAMHAAREQIAALLEKYAPGVSPDAVVGELSVGQQQRIEIVKTLYRGAEILILDEPTAVLTPQEVDAFFETVRDLRSAGKTIIIITHKLREVMALSDRLTILRAGKNVGTLDTAATTPEEIARLMVGRNVVLPVLEREVEEAKGREMPSLVDVHDIAKHPALRTDKISLTGSRSGAPLLDSVCLEIHPGEILGIAGVEGNGQTELVDVLTGLRRPTSGRVFIGERDVTALAPRQKFSAGLACIPEDRHRKGMILDFTLRENLKLGRHRDRRFVKMLKSRERVSETLRDFDVRPADPTAFGRQLSGGNQQKLIIAREFTRKAKVLIAAQPTRGIDLGAIQFIHERLLKLRAEGKAILLVSAELSEILSLSDRIAVMYRGQIVFTSANVGLKEHDLGIYMAGGQPAA